MHPVLTGQLADSMLQTPQPKSTAIQSDSQKDSLLEAPRCLNFTLKLTKQSGSLLGDEEKGMFSLDFTNLQVISIVHFLVSSVNYIFPLKNYVLGECSLHHLSISTRTQGS